MKLGRNITRWSVTIGVLLATALIVVAQRPADSQGNGGLYVANLNNSDLRQFAPTTNGNISPALTLTGAATLLFAPNALAIDAAGNAYVTNLATGQAGTGSVTIYSSGASGNTAPTATISGIATLLAEPQGVALDGAGNIYVANLSNIVTEYASGSSGNAAPLNTISGPDTMLAGSDGIALDSHGTIYVANLIGGASAGGSITIYAPGSNGDVAPTAVISGPATLLSAPEALAIDGAGSIYVANLAGGTSNLGSIVIYASGSSGNATPSAIIAGADTGLLGPQGIALDSSANIYVSTSSNSIQEYAHGSSGDATPIATLNGPNTGLNGPRGLAFQPQTSSTPTPTPATPTPTPTAVATATATRTPTPTPTATATATATVTSTATSTATATVAPTETPTPTPLSSLSPTATPSPTPTIVCPTFSGNAQSDAKAPKPPKLPKFKPIKFSAQTVGTTSAPTLITIPATTGLMVTGVSVNDADFLPTTTCSGQSVSCSVAVAYRPSRVGTSRGALSIANNLKTLSIALSGSGIGPKVKSLSERSLPPLQPLTLNGTGFDPDRSIPLLVSFTEKIKKAKQPVVLLVPASDKTGSTVQVQVPPIFDPNTKELIPGTATLSVSEVLKPGTTLISKSPSLQIAQLNATDQLPAGAATLAFLQAEENFAVQLETDVMNTPLSGLGPSLKDAADALKNLLTILSANPNADLGSIGGTQITASANNLVLADLQILQMLNTMAGNSVSSATRIGPATGTGCLAAEAAQALADTGNPAAFANDIAQFFKDSETSAACKQPVAAIATLGIVNGTGGVALAIAAQANNPSLQALLPADAILLAYLAPGGQLLSIGATLAQTSAQARQSVQDAVASFELASSGELAGVIGQSQGPLNNSYSSVSQTATSFDTATPPPLDGAYVGTFTGTQFVSSVCSGPISGPLAFNVAGSAIAAGAAIGTLDPESGAASFPVGGLGGSNVTCSFGGILLPNQNGPAAASGTWSCLSTGAGSSFNSANGTWTATAQ